MPGRRMGRLATTDVLVQRNHWFVYCAVQTRTPIENYKNLSKMCCLHYKIGFKFDIITAVLILHLCTRVRYLKILNGNTTEGNLPEFVSRGAHVYHPPRWCIVVVRGLSDFPLAN